MRIACVNQDPGVAPGRSKGAAVHLLAMRHAFAEAGAEVVALDLADDGALASAFGRALPLDLVYERHALGRCAGARLARAHRIPYALEVNAPLADEAALYRGVEPSAEDEARDREAFTAADLVLAVSEPVARYAERRGAAPERVTVVPNAVDPAVFRPRAAGDALRARVAPESKFVLGFHGRLRPWHGFELLSQATAELLLRGLDVHLLIVGEGDFETHLAGRVPPERVTRVPWVPHEEVASWVACMDVLPLTYRSDAPFYFSPLKLAEAMACGVVPVAPKLCDLDERLEHGRAGLLYAPGDLRELVQCLEVLARQPALRASRAEAAQRAAGRHTWRHVAGGVLSRLGLTPAPMP